MTADTARWKAWNARTRATLAALQFGAPPRTTADLERQEFFDRYYRANQPVVSMLPPEWPLHLWSLPALRARIPDGPVQVQTGRLADPDYEIRADKHRSTMQWHAFLDRVEHGPDNDVYLTAGNTAQSSHTLARLFQDFRPPPIGLTNRPDQGHIWIGKRTVTPLHHDLSNNLMCQVMGHKLCRLVSPDQVDRLDYRQHVFSSIQWLTDEIAAERGIKFLDVVLSPGESLFLPVGWWHQCQALDVSGTIVFTNFDWPNSFNSDFQPQG